VSSRSYRIRGLDQSSSSPASGTRAGELGTHVEQETLSLVLGAFRCSPASHGPQTAQRLILTGEVAAAEVLRSVRQ
jgi:hypothetical protein